MTISTFGGNPVASVAARAQGLELVKDRQTKEPAPVATLALLEGAR